MEKNIKIQNGYLADPVEEKVNWEKTPEGFLRCHARILASRIMTYGREEFGETALPIETDTINVNVPMAALADSASLRSLETALVVAGVHNWCELDNVKEVSVGNVVGTPFVEGEYVYADLLVTDPGTIKKIETKELGEISAAYLAELIFKAGNINGQPFDAEQAQLRYNHICILPVGEGRAGTDVRIMNVNKLAKQEGDRTMSDRKEDRFRVQLKNTGKFVNADEETAEAIQAETTASDAKLETLMSDCEAAKTELAEKNAEVEELKGQLAVYKEKLDALLSEDTISAAAEEMIKEGEDAAEIIENCSIKNEKGEEASDEEKEKVLNSARKLRGQALYSHVLGAIGVKTEGMSPEMVKGAFSAQVCIVNSMRGKKPHVAGATFLNQGRAKETIVRQAGGGRTALQRLGYPDQS